MSSKTVTRWHVPDNSLIVGRTWEVVHASDYDILAAEIERLRAALRKYVEYDEYINGPEGDSSTDRLQRARAALAGEYSAVETEARHIVVCDENCPICHPQPTTLTTTDDWPTNDRHKGGTTIEEREAMSAEKKSGLSSPVSWQCAECGHEWEAFSRGPCPKCRPSGTNAMYDEQGVLVGYHAPKTESPQVYYCVPCMRDVPIEHKQNCPAEKAPADPAEVERYKQAVRERVAGPLLERDNARLYGHAVPPTHRYELWLHLHDEHGLTLMESELDEIERLASKTGDEIKREFDPFGAAPTEKTEPPCTCPGWAVSPDCKRCSPKADELHPEGGAI
jgi:hypothetical protein